MFVGSLVKSPACLSHVISSSMLQHFLTAFYFQTLLALNVYADAYHKLLKISIITMNQNISCVTKSCDEMIKGFLNMSSYKCENNTVSQPPSLHNGNSHIWKDGRYDADLRAIWTP